MDQYAGVTGSQGLPHGTEPVSALVTASSALSVQKYKQQSSFEHIDQSRDLYKSSSIQPEMDAEGSVSI